VWEIGALRALEEACEGRPLTELDRYVGVSAGSFIAACLANGIAPAELVRMLFRHEPGEPRFHPGAFFTPAYREWARRGAALPRHLAAAVAAFRLAAHGSSAAAAVGAVGRLIGAAPVGAFDNEPIRRFVHALFTRPGRSDDFRALGPRLVVVAADLMAARTVPFGAPGHDEVPISRAVQASTAVPGVYTPVLIDGRPHVDGAMLKTVHASAVLDDDVGLLLVLNPIAPVDATRDRRAQARSAHPERATDLMTLGLGAVLSQTVRAVLHSRMRTALDGYHRRFPALDLVLLEPAPDELGVFHSDIFSFHERERLCALAYQATRRDLLQRFDDLAPRLAAHGIVLRRDVLEDAERTLWRGVGLREPRPAPRTTMDRLRHAARRLDRAPARR
jgi:predicted acylesterase/phospholipase RssA